MPGARRKKQKPSPASCEHGVPPLGVCSVAGCWNSRGELTLVRRPRLLMEIAKEKDRQDELKRERVRLRRMRTRAEQQQRTRIKTIEAAQPVSGRARRAHDGEEV